MLASTGKVRSPHGGGHSADHHVGHAVAVECGEDCSSVLVGERRRLGLGPKQTPARPGLGCSCTGFSTTMGGASPALLGNRRNAGGAAIQRVPAHRLGAQPPVLVLKGRRPPKRPLPPAGRPAWIAAVPARRRAAMPPTLPASRRDRHGASTGPGGRSQRLRGCGTASGASADAAQPHRRRLPTGPSVLGAPAPLA